MMLRGGEHRKRRILSKHSVDAMTMDQLTKGQKSSALVPGFFGTHGWGFGMSVVTAGDELTPIPGRYGWDGGMGTSWFNDPNEGLVAILMTSRMWKSASPPDVCLDFWKQAHDAIHR